MESRRTNNTPATVSASVDTLPRKEQRRGHPQVIIVSQCQRDTEIHASSSHTNNSDQRRRRLRQATTRLAGGNRSGLATSKIDRNRNRIMALCDMATLNTTVEERCKSFMTTPKSAVFMVAGHLGIVHCKRSPTTTNPKRVVDKPAPPRAVRPERKPFRNTVDVTAWVRHSRGRRSLCHHCVITMSLKE